MFNFGHVFAQHLYDGESDEFYLAENRISLQDGELVDANGTPVGEYLAMDQALESQFNRGMIKPNYRASFALLDKNFRSSP